MKRIARLLGALALMALVSIAFAPGPHGARASSSTASYTFNYTGGLQTFTVPGGVTTLTIQAVGAEANYKVTGGGGRGASMQGDFAVTPGEQLTVLVGGSDPSTTESGGAGGSFVWVGTGNVTTSNLLIAAGGGGGMRAEDPSSDALITPGSNTDGGRGGPSSSGCSGTAWESGDAGGGGGGGITGNGGQGGPGPDGNPGGTGGKAIDAGGAGGSPAGAFGGGGGGQGGGGGGYSGGDGGSGCYGGSGGTSFNAGANQVNTARAGTGLGQVVMSWADTTPPVVTVTAPSGATQVGGTPWYGTSPVSVPVSATDDGSVAAITCTDNGSADTVGSLSGIGTQKASGVTYASGDGTHVISCTATDGAGNSSAASGPGNSTTVRIDTTAPWITFNLPDAPAGGWFTSSPVTGTVTANDAGAGVAVIYCGDSLTDATLVNASNLSGGSVTEPISVTGDGTHNLRCSATDALGLPGEVFTATVKIDANPPQLSTAPALDSCSLPGANGWCRGTQTAGFSVSDAGSGTASPCASPAGGSCQFTRTSTATGAAVSIASGAVSDLAGNTAAGISAGPYKIDGVAPVTTAAVQSGAQGSNGWYTGAVALALTAADNANGSGVAQTYYGIDAPACTPPATGTTVSSSCQTGASVTVSADGQHSVTFFSVDQAGNFEAPQSLAVKIDGTAPATPTLSFPATPASGWYTTAAVGGSCPSGGCVSATDATSGVDAITCTDSAGGLTAGALANKDTAGAPATETLAVSGEGSHSLSCTAKDAAGNASAAGTATIKIDGVPPALKPALSSTIPCPAPLTGTCVAQGASVTASAGATDATSGVDTQKTSCDPVDTNSGGTHTITCRAADLAGNTASATLDYTVVQVVTGTASGSLVVGPGQIVAVTGGTVNGSLTVQKGGTLTLQNASVHGALSASGAGGLTICGSTLSGSTSISGSSGLVQIGSGAAGAPACAGNTVRGGLSLSGNTGGVAVGGNQISGSLSCSGNSPAPTNNGQPNTVRGSRSGQCSGL